MDPSEDSPSSMWMIRAAELFPKLQIEKEDDELSVPFSELAGESVKYVGRWENGILAISNFRFFIQHSAKHSVMSIPIRLIENVQIKDIFQLLVFCKDAVTYSCTFTTSETTLEWYNRLAVVTCVPEQLEQLFAFPFHAWVSESAGSLDHEWYNRLQHATEYDEEFRREIDRLQFDMKGAWRISNINQDFKLCQSYPRMLIVPACIADETLQNVASFRSSRRIPAVTWRHSSGAVIARSSQPEVGWLGWRNSKDEQLLKALADACSFDNGKIMNMNDTESSLETSQTEKVNIEKPKKILIVDARSYASAVTNRARGGGVECPEYYTSAEIQFMNLGNIHVIRKSYHALRLLCASPPDVPNWHSLLERTLWLQHISSLLAANLIVCHAIERNHRPVLVHCSDGWDRTPQICATAQLCLDPYYRTIEGFRVLVEKEWLSFGHKFGDRVGHGVGSEDSNERCPVFIQWLDCVHQIHRQYPCSFEFSLSYLVKLAQHVLSCLFGTFLCNTFKERLENSIFDRTFSVWPFLSTAIYKNPLYQPPLRDGVIWPAHNVRDLSFWKEVYFGSFSNHPSREDSNMSGVESPNEKSLSKTRSFDDLVKEMKNRERRLSDPSISINGEIPMNIFQEDCVDLNDSMLSDKIKSLVVDNDDSNSNGDDINVNNGECDHELDGKDDATKPAADANFDNSTKICDESSDTLVPEEPANNKDCDDTVETTEEHQNNVVENGDENDSRPAETESEATNDEVDSSSDKDQPKPHEDSQQQQQQVNGQQTLKHQQVPLTRRHLQTLQRLDSRKNENVEEFSRNNGYCDYNGLNNSNKNYPKDSISSNNDSRMSTPGIQMASNTPICYFDRNSSLSSNPDGLSHAVNQENLRLHQIVHEYKLKEEALQRELHYMRLALLKQNSCQCNNAVKDKHPGSHTSEDMHPVIDCNSENSNASWEAIDEKNPAFPVLWVPDHAITRCQNCQIDFWLGRRKHHCRSCGQIFCADCSQYFAPFPKESFLEPVRLCEPCFTNATNQVNQQS